MKYYKSILEKAEWVEEFSCYHRLMISSREKYDIPADITHIKDVNVPSGLYIGMEHRTNFADITGLLLVSESKLKRFWVIDDPNYMNVCQEIKNYLDGGMTLDQVYILVGL